MGKTITKSDLINTLHSTLGINKSESKKLVESFFDEIKSSLIRNEKVKLSGFGNFELIDKNSRPGRNTKTGEHVVILARKVVTFRAGQKLRKRVKINKSD